jgi:hypothetical protein
LLIGPSALLMAIAMRRAVVGIAQAEPDALAAIQAKRHLPFDRRAIGDPPGGGHAPADRCRRTPRGDRGGGERTLRHGIDLPIRGQQWRDQQRPAGQVGGVPQRRDRDIDPAAAAGKRRQFGRYHDGRDVLRGQLGHLVAGIDAQPFQHTDQRFPGEHRIVQLVARTVQPDHQAVADQLVATHAFHVRDVLDADLRGGGQPGKTQQQDEHAMQARTSAVGRSKGFCVTLLTARHMWQQGTCHAVPRPIGPWPVPLPPGKNCRAARPDATKGAETVSTIEGMGMAGAIRSSRRTGAVQARSGFTLPELRDTATSGVTTAAPVALDAMLSLQEVAGASEQDRQARRQGQSMLALLAALQSALLAQEDAGDPALLGRLATLLASTTYAVDPTLAAALAAIRLRVRLELARRGR